MILWDPAPPSCIGPLKITPFPTTGHNGSFFSQKLPLYCCSRPRPFFSPSPLAHWFPLISLQRNSSLYEEHWGLPKSKRDVAAKNTSFSLTRSQGLRERLKNKNQVLDRYS
ncbi:hypothetical protein AMTRI_Chr08g206370 [Amborella trichopoda]